MSDTEMEGWRWGRRRCWIDAGAFIARYLEERCFGFVITGVDGIGEHSLCGMD